MTIVDSDVAARSEWDAKLPRKRMAASVVFRDAAGNVLLVEPTYKDRWEVPGGAVELDESPLAAALREVEEELGLKVGDLRMLAVDWVPPRPGRSEGLIVVFEGGVMSDEQRAGIVLAGQELRSLDFVPLDKVGEFLSPLIARRVVAAVTALENGGGVVYLEHGVAVS